jgi:hypothetical protein
MKSIISIFYSYSHAEVHVDGKRGVFSIPNPEIFGKKWIATQKLSFQIGLFKWMNGSWKSRLFLQPEFVCWHDGVIATPVGRKIPATQGTVLMPSSLAVAAGNKKIEAEDLRIATATLIVDVNYSSFQIIHGGGVMFSEFCWDISKEKSFQEYLTKIKTIYRRVATLKPSDSNLYNYNEKEIISCLEHEGYWQTFSGVAKSIRERGIYIFGSMDSKLFNKFSEAASECDTNLTTQFDLHDAVWVGLSMSGNILNKKSKD